MDTARKVRILTKLAQVSGATLQIAKKLPKAAQPPKQRTNKRGLPGGLGATAFSARQAVERPKMSAMTGSS